MDEITEVVQVLDSEMAFLTTYFIYVILRRVNYLHHSLYGSKILTYTSRIQEYPAGLSAVVFQHITNVSQTNANLIIKKQYTNIKIERPQQKTLRCPSLEVFLLKWQIHCLCRFPIQLQFGCNSMWVMYDTHPHIILCIHCRRSHSITKDMLNAKHGMTNIKGGVTNNGKSLL